MRALLIFILVLANIYVHGQKFDTDDYYKNGKLKYKGKFTSCVVDVVGGVHIYERRKTGKWIYYYPSGGIKRIEYHTKTKSCKTKIHKEGKWKYFNEEGELYREEKYERDTLIFKETPIYNKDQLIGKLTFHLGSIDTMYFIEPAYSKNLIPNSGFEYYFYKSVNIINDGQDKIEDIIPYWSSPDDATPDYYNTNRKISGVPNNIGEQKTPIEGSGYLGLITYLHPKYKNDPWELSNNLVYGDEYVYSESIQSRLNSSLEKEKKYCFKAQIMLSQNAGLSIDKFGVFFSEGEVKFKRDKFPETAQLLFHDQLSNTKEWTTLCGVFVAKGNEQYITLGRFAIPGQTSMIINSPVKSSPLDINKSAYYLLDDIQLFEIASREECKCSPKSSRKIDKSNPSTQNLKDYFDLNDENKVILKNVLFDFDSINFKNSSLTELHILFNYLIANPHKKILITGHTDNEGSKDYNKQLSLERAMSIKKWLVEEGIDPLRITCAGKGFDIPLENNNNELNKSLNRRVEFEVIKN